MVVTASLRRHRSGAKDERGVFFSLYRHHSGCRAILYFDGNGIRWIPGSPDQPHRGRRRRCQVIRIDSLPLRPMECRHSGVPGGIGQHRFADEQGGWFGSFWPLGFQAREVEDGGADSHHPARHSDIHRRLLQLSYRGFGNAPHRRTQRRDQGKARLSHRLHSSTGLHHLTYLQLGSSRIGLRIGRRKRTGALLQSDTFQFLRLLHHPLHVWYRGIGLRLQGDE